MPDLFKAWPKKSAELSPAEVIDLYDRGFAGATYDPAEVAATAGAPRRLYFRDIRTNP